jgi:Tol biopolymer transport system component
MTADVIGRGHRLRRMVNAGTCLLAASLLSAPAARATFPGSNGQIAYANTRSGAIVAIGPNGMGRHRITHGSNDIDPAYSPDGSKLAFGCGPSERTARICAVNADGSGRTHLTGTARVSFEPAFSPDGSQIVYSAAPRNGYSDLWVMNADGSDKHRLTHTDGNDGNPRYSPDGKRIVFQRVHAYRNDISVAIVNAGGSRLRDLTRRPHDRFSGWPDFSPDGTKIVYASFHHNRAGIWLMNADGSNQHQLTPPSATFDFSPVFSPNGKRIAFDDAAFHDSAKGINLMNADGSHLRRLPNTSPYDIFPDWGAG